MVQRPIVRWLHRDPMGAGHVSKGIVLLRRRFDVWGMIVADLDPLTVAIVSVVMMILHNHGIHRGLGTLGALKLAATMLAVAVLVVGSYSNSGPTDACG